MGKRFNWFFWLIILVAVAIATALFFYGQNNFQQKERQFNTHLALEKEQFVRIIDKKNSPGKLVDLGRRLAVFDIDSATAAFKRAVDLDKNYRDGWLHLGYGYLRQEKWPEAADALEKAIALDPLNAASRQLLISAYERTNQPDKVEEQKKILETISQ